jgi:predicted XRE-type DNA-binding protein
MNKMEAYKSVWDAITDTPEEAANLQARSEMKIAVIIRANDWKQA